MNRLYSMPVLILCLWLLFALVPAASAVNIEYFTDSETSRSDPADTGSAWSEPVQGPFISMTPRSSTRPYSHGDPTDIEQLLLELVNSSRADPSGAAAYYGVNLNQGLEAGTITSSPKQPLAFNPQLITSAGNHSQWMLNTQTFSHTGQGGSTSRERMEQAGYIFSGSWKSAENIGWSGTTGTFDAEAHAYNVIESLFLSPGHRKNTLSEKYSEIGIGGRTGSFEGRNGLMVTENFADSQSTPTPMLVGVVYSDTNRNSRYDPGEGISGVTITHENGAYHAVTSSSGGYALPVTAARGTLTVTASGGGMGQSMTRQVNFSGQNIKVDFTPGQGGVPSPPEKLSPADGSSVSGSSVTFQWEPSSGADYYWIQIRPVDIYMDYVYEKVGNSTTYTWTNAPADGSRIMWQVMAGNEYGDGHWSGFWYFTSQSGTSRVPGAPVLNEPADGAVISGTRADFSWSIPSGNPGWYHLQVSPDPEFIRDVYENHEIPVTYPYIQDLPNNGTRYYWRVRAGNSYGWGPWSETRNFLNSPAGNDSDVIFNWLEGMFPDILIPAPQQTREVEGIIYRYYSGTNVFLATYMGGLYFIDNYGQVHYLGRVDYWLPQAR